MTADVHLRAVEPEDVDFMLDCESESDAARWSSYRAPLSRRQLFDYALSYDADPFSAGQLRLVICLEDGTRVGLLDLYDISEKDSRAWTGICIHPLHRRLGIALKALLALKRLNSERLGIRQLLAEVAVENTAAFGLFTKAGFGILATLPAWHRIGDRFLDFYLFSSLTQR